jgi:uncharacterized protein with HEPN domain
MKHSKSKFIKSDSIYIEHILNSINSIQEYISGLSLEIFLDDRKTQDAVVRQFEIIGEATKRISSDFQDNHPNIPWSQMAGMRDVLIHDYIDVNFEIVWKTAIENIPVVKEAILKL